ncbi:MAG: hypothetical protein H6684_12270 [Deltaproteobacteria bacterium]|nr:hypothetical protein [bacterium]MCB9477667.1 hypothetical protein [Deltaproteobacteria bacterium]MCB9489501.1 hypothetical protein [Deltaproteobacteria bacterium]
MRLMLCAMVAGFLLVLSGCSEYEKAFEEANTSEQPFDQEVEGLSVQGLGQCTASTTSFSQIMDGVDWWEEAEDYITDVKLSGISYRITENHSTQPISLELYLSDDLIVEDVKDADLVGWIDTLEPGETVTTWTQLHLSPGMLERLESFIEEPDTTFAFCALVPEVADGDLAEVAADLKVEVRVEGKVYVEFIR